MDDAPPVFDVEPCQRREPFVQQCRRTLDAPLQLGVGGYDPAGCVYTFD